MEAAVADFSEKGGVGKTSTASGLIAVAAKRGMKVVGVDLDPRHTLTKELGATGAEFSLNDLLFVDAEADEPPGDPAVLVHQALTAAGDQWPANVRVLASERPLGRRETDPTTFELRLRRALDGLDDVDLVVMDVPPRAGGKLASTALIAADRVLIPATLTADGYDGALEAVKTIRHIGAPGGLNPGLRISGIVRSIVPRDRDRREIHDHWDGALARDFEGHLLPVQIHSYAVREVCRTACAPITMAPGREARKLEDVYGKLLDSILGDRS